jgi:hypothetical protein
VSANGRSQPADRSVIIGMEDLRSRCVMTAFDPDSGAVDLKYCGIYSEFNGRLEQ